VFEAQAITRRERCHIEASRDVKRSLEYLLFGLGAGCAGLEIGTIFIRADLTVGFQLGDLLTLIFAPLVVPGLVWAIWRTLRSAESSEAPRNHFAPLLLWLGALWYAEGVGVNIGANAIARYLVGEEATLIGRLTYLLDERIGHLLWHAGIVSLTFSMTLAAWHAPATPARRTLPVVAGGILFGFTWFADGVEGQTVPLMLPAAVALLALVGWWRRGIRQLRTNPVMAFCVVAASFALLLFLVWALWHRGFPQFSSLGWV
jgi:hypothetical protein